MLLHRQECDDRIDLYGAFKFGPKYGPKEKNFLPYPRRYFLGAGTCDAAWRSRTRAFQKMAGRTLQIQERIKKLRKCLLISFFGVDIASFIIRP